MRAFGKPQPAYDYDPAAEIQAIRRYRDTEPGRAIPVPTAGHLLFATWNIANLGVHKRRDRDYQLLAEIVSWFELVAVQEVADDLTGLEAVMSHLPARFRVVFTDKAGNDERAAYYYDTRRVKLADMAGEIGITESERDEIALPGIARAFEGFNRNPYLASFAVERSTLLFVNAHLYYGSTETAAQKRASVERRQLEAFAIGRWCDLRRKSHNAYTKHILALGDFNLPERAPGNPIYDALTERGLKLPPHTTRIPHTNIANSADYDQIAFVPGLKRDLTAIGVFDFDGIIFRRLWTPPATSYWRTCTKYYISDHRPLWAQLKLPN